MSIWNKTSREQDGQLIQGTYVKAFIHNGDTYFLTDIKIYQDGMVDCWGLVDFNEFKKKVAAGWVATTLPEGSNVSISLLSQFKVVELNSWIREDEFIKEVADEIERLNGRPTADDKCRDALKEFQENQSEEGREKLKQAYESVPEHNRRHLLGDMDVKDIPIRMIIYGEEEIEKWSHRLAARKMGVEPLPNINVPGALKVKKT